MFLNTTRLALLVLCVSSATGCQAEAPVGDPHSVATRLMTLLDDPSEDVRRTSALSLGKIGHVVAAPALARALSDPDPLVRAYSAWALGQIGEEVNDRAAISLVGALSDTHDAVKQAAARALGNVGPRQPVLAALMDVLAVGASGSRRAVVETLTQIEAPGAYQDLVKALTDPDPAVRQSALAALGELADRRVLADFRQRLLRDTHAGVRAEAAYRLGKLGEAGDVADLEWAATNDAVPTVRVWATWARDSIVGEGGK